MDMTLIFNFAAAMLSVVNPIGNLPIFITYTAGERKQVRTWIAVFIALTVFVLLTVFLVIGTGLLNFFGITIAAFRISGGILLLLTGIAMVRGGQAKHHDELVAKGKQTDLKEAEFVYGRILVPLGIPLFVGPGAISTVILYSSQIQNPATQLGLIGVLGAIAGCVVHLIIVCFPPAIVRQHGNGGGHPLAGIDSGGYWHSIYIEWFSKCHHWLD